MSNPLREIALLFTISCVAATNVMAVEVVKFEKLDSPYAVTTMTATPDGGLLLVGHEAENKITIWDAATQKKVKEVDCPAPRHLLVRGDRTYVANFGKGTISVFDKDWRLINQVEAGTTNVYYLSAPGGEYFQDRLLATGWSDGRGGCAAMVVDIEKDEHRPLHSETYMSVATVDYEGRYLIKQGVFGHSPGGTVVGYELNEPLGEKRDHGKRGAHTDTPFLAQWRDTQFWIGDRAIATGLPPAPSLSKDGRHLLIADQIQPVFYEFHDGTLTARALNDTFTDLGKCEYTCPDECELLHPGRDSAARQHRDFMLYHHLAITRGMQLVFYVLDADARGKAKHIYFARTQPFAVPQHVVNATRFPETIAEGKPLRFNLFGKETQGEFEVISGPEGLQISSAGVLAWTPGKADVGEHNIKIRAVMEGKTSFQRLKVEVVSADLAAAAEGDLDRLKHAGTFDFESPVQVLAPSLDRKSILVVAGNTLQILDANGMFARSEHTLPKPYKEFKERPGYYVGLSDNSADLIHKSTFKVSRGISLPAGRTMDLALHPGRPVAYATTYDNDGGRRTLIEANRLLEIDEQRGKVRELPRIYGTWVEADPTGRYLFVALRARYERGLRIDWYVGRVLPEYGEIDLLLSYDMRGRMLRHVDTNVKAGTNGSGIHVSPDGRHIAYVSGAGTPTYSYSIPAFRAEDVEASAASYKTGAYPRDIDFHAMLDLVAATNGKECKIFQRNSGQELTSRLKLKDPRIQKSVNRVMFTPSGTHVILGRGRTRNAVKQLVSVPLDLTPEEYNILEKGFRRPEVAPRRNDAEPSPPARGDDGSILVRGGKVPAVQLQALVGRSASRPVTAKEISHYYTPAVVLIDSGEGVGTGFIIGKEGYILTCAHTLSVVGDPTVTYQTRDGSDAKVEKVRGRVVRFDRDGDLALLKIDAKSPLRTVQFRMAGKVESAEDVTVIGNPGAGETILRNTVTTGIVSNVRREIDGQELIQTSAPINPGNSGGPMFNDHGQVIGVVVSKARLENIGFAIPIDHVLTFLDVENDEATIAVKAEPPRRPRTWTDNTGRYRIRASLVKVKGENVQLRRQTGEVIAVPIERLSDADKRFLKSVAK